MNYPEFKDTVCRVCLDENVVLHWSNTLVEHCNVTYEECYYRYTQLEPLDVDPFSSMLCQSCRNGLENIHSLVVKAMDSYNFLLEVNCVNFETDDSQKNDDINCSSTDFETVLVENVDTESLIEDQFEYESSDEFLKRSPIKDEDDQFDFCSSSNTQMEIEFSFDIDNEYKDYHNNCSLRVEGSEDNASESVDVIRKPSKRTNSTKIKNHATYVENNISKKFKVNNNEWHKKEAQNDKSEDYSVNEKVGGGKTSKKHQAKKTQYNSQNTRSMCSFCSKILHNKYALQKHEKIHNVNRERKAVCPICGVKYFDESYLKSHMRIHSNNRVKKHKCEFCDKAFYEKGGLNVHRRIHLGKMIPCNLCPKEFFRQVDLDIHMNSHSAAVINAETKKRSRYWVRCKYCNKTIMSTSFKSHTAVHLNEPLMRCSICNKEFFRRDSCTQHLKTIHQKATEDYSDFIIVYNKNRLSHLYLEQKADMQVNED